MNSFANFNVMMNIATGLLLVAAFLAILIYQKKMPSK
jgi:hypothetical protein